jgi:ABC-type glutathione transport system ATPase component
LPVEAVTQTFGILGMRGSGKTTTASEFEPLVKMEGDILEGVPFRRVHLNGDRWSVCIGPMVKHARAPTEETRLAVFGWHSWAGNMAWEQTTIEVFGAHRLIKRAAELGMQVTEWWDEGPLADAVREVQRG